MRQYPISYWRFSVSRWHRGWHVLQLNRQMRLPHILSCSLLGARLQVHRGLQLSLPPPVYTDSTASLTRATMQQRLKYSSCKGYNKDDIVLQGSLSPFVQIDVARWSWMLWSWLQPRLKKRLHCSVIGHSLSRMLTISIGMITRACLEILHLGNDNFDDGE